MATRMEVGTTTAGLGGQAQGVARLRAALRAVLGPPAARAVIDARRLEARLDGWIFYCSPIGLRMTDDRAYSPALHTIWDVRCFLAAIGQRAPFAD